MTQGLGTAEMLGAVRERELRRAMAMVGVAPIRLLPYRDSGMAGSPPNDDSRSLIQADRSALLADVVYQIRELRPKTVITFGPDGVYGHPDHIRIGEIATEAVTVAAGAEFPVLGDPWITSQLFHVAVAREDLLEASKRPNGPFSGASAERVARMGIPRSEITHVFDVSPYIPGKLAVIRSHATQLPFNNGEEADGDPGMRPFLGKASLKRILLPWSDSNVGSGVLDTINTL